MNIGSLLWLSLRNYLRHLNRYSVVLISLVVVTAALTIVIGLVSGLTASIRSKSARYFAGDIAVQAFEYRGGNTTRVSIADPSFLEGFVEPRAAQIMAISRRAVLSAVGNDLPPQLFFNGDYISQRRIIGIEWELERAVLAGLTLQDGGIPNAGDRDGILISSVVATRLGAQTGDQVFLSGDTASGQRNVRMFIISGIFNEGSFFGYASYVQREALNEFINVPLHQVDEVGIYLNNQNNRNKQRVLAQELWADLSNNYQVLPVLYSRSERTEYNDQSREGDFLTILPLGAQVAEVTELIDALVLIAYIVLALFAILIFIGISNTFSMTVIERSKEIATLRALGMGRDHIMKLFLSESGYLSLNGTVIGIMLGLFILTLGNQLIDVASVNVATLFLQNGKIPWQFSLGSGVLVFFLALASCVGGVWRPAYQASRMHPAEFLNQE